MPLNKFNVAKLRLVITFIIILILGILFYFLWFDNEKLRYGNRYKIVSPIYLVGVYNSLNNKQLSEETAVSYLEAVESAKRSFHAFQCEVPVGTIMVINGSAPKVFPLPFFANRYFVSLDPDLSRGLKVIIALNRGIEGSLDGLNPELFHRQPTD